jgi:murein DD-endopeptidase MepM/ murein hydrolase activator NlpD
MDDEVVVKPAYPRRSLPSRRRKRNNKEKSRLFIILTRQIILAILLLLIAGGVKAINSPATDYLTGKIRLALEENVDINNIYSQIMGHIDSLRNNPQIEGSETDIKDTAIPASTEVYSVEESDEWKLDYGGVIEDDTDQVSMEENGDGTPVEKEENSSAETGTQSSTVNNNTMIVPVSGVLGSKYGDRIHPIKGTEKFHNGIDIKANSGTPIKAALDGEVIEASFEATYGNFVEMKHPGGLMTIYAHCESLIAKRGQMVKKGEIIAKVGSTGDSTGPHLHFEVWKNGSPVDPLGYIKVSGK